MAFPRGFPSSPFAPGAEATGRTRTARTPLPFPPATPVTAAPPLTAGPRGRHADEDDGPAVLEVGAGLPGGTSFLRGTLAGPGGDAAEDVAGEVVVKDRFARLDAGLPPLPPGEGLKDESLMPPSPAARPAPPAVARVWEESGSESGSEGPAPDEEPPPLRLVRPAPREAGEPGEPEEPRPAAAMAVPVVEFGPEVPPSRRGIFRAFRG